MPAPYSQDLRDRVVSAVSNGSSGRGAAKRFGIGLGTAVRWAQRLRAEGHARARAMGGDRRSRLTGHREAVLTLIAHQPDLTLKEIRGALIERHGMTVGLGTVSRFLASHTITLKKSKNGKTGCLLRQSGGVEREAGDVTVLVPSEAGGRANPGSAPVCLSGMRTGDADPLQQPSVDRVAAGFGSPAPEDPAL